MTIELISQEQYDELLKIQKNHSALTFQNNGYEYIDKSKLSDEDKQALKTIETMLKKHIKGFEKFNNFRFDSQNRLKIRFQYDWSADEESRTIPFTGVGYLLVDELLNGFENKTNQLP